MKYFSHEKREISLIACNSICKIWIIKKLALRCKAVFKSLFQKTNLGNFRPKGVCFTRVLKKSFEKSHNNAFYSKNLSLHCLHCLHCLHSFYSLRTIKVMTTSMPKPLPAHTVDSSAPAQPSHESDKDSELNTSNDMQEDASKMLNRCRCNNNKRNYE